MYLYIKTQTNCPTNPLHSNDTPGQDSPVEQSDPRDGQQTPGRPAAQGRPAGRRTDARLRPESVAPVQEARQQKLPEHLSAIGHPSFEQHSVSAASSRRIQIKT